MGFTKSCTAAALAAIVASVALLLATMFLPNWVEAVWRQDGEEDCKVGNLGAFEAELTADAECAKGTEGYPLETYSNFRSDTLEFWPLFPMQATGNGNAIPGVANTTFESCDASLNSLDATLVGLLGAAEKAASAPVGSVRGIAVGGAELVTGIVGGLTAALAQVSAAGSVYTQIAAIAPLYFADPTDSRVADAFGAVVLGAAAFNVTTTVEEVEEAFKGVGFACACVGKPAGICPLDTTPAVQAIQGTLAQLQVSVDCSTPEGQATIGEKWLTYSSLTGFAGAINTTEVAQFVGGSYELFADLPTITDENRFAAMYKTNAQLFIASPKVKAFLVTSAQAKKPEITEEILDNMLGLVGVCACHLNSAPSCAATAFLPTIMFYVDGQIQAPAPAAYGLFNPTCTEILELVGPAVTFYGRDQVGAQALIIGTEFQIYSQTGSLNTTAVGSAVAILASTKTLFSDLNLQEMLEDPIAFDFVNGPVLNAILMSGNAPDRAIEDVLPIIGRCICNATATVPAAAVYCPNAPTEAAYASFRLAITGSADAITDIPACFAYNIKFSQHTVYGRAWSGLPLSQDRSLAEKECTDDNTDQEHITLGRTMLIVALPILIIGTLAAILAANKAFADNAEGFKMVAVVAGLCAILSAGLTLFGLLHVRAAPVYAAVGAECVGPKICYQNDFASTIALGAALAPIIAGVSFLVVAFVGVAGEAKSVDLESPRDSQIVANPKFSI